MKITTAVDSNLEVPVACINNLRWPRHKITSIPSTLKLKVYLLRANGNAYET